MQRVTVVGGSLAGLRAAQALRRDGFDGGIVVVEPDPNGPYDRPPLSKAFITGDDASAAVRTPIVGLDELELTWRRGRSAVSLDVARRSVTLDDEESVESDGIVLACGASPRRIPGTEGIAGVHVLRTLDDARALRADLEGGPWRVVIIGAGFIGAEVAASARARGHDVVVVEALERPLARVLPQPLADLCGALHAAHGVELRCGVGVDTITSGPSGRVAGVALVDGSALEADVVLVGIGVVPNTRWLEGSGLTIDNGVVCDATLLAAPGIVAAGDVARWPSPRFGETIRVEHWENAVDMGAHAGARLLAGDHGDVVGAYDPVPWFWSDQYGRKIQLAGRCAATDVVHVLEDDADTGRYLALIGRGDRLVGVFGINRPAPVQKWRTRIADNLPWAEALALAASS